MSVAGIIGYSPASVMAGLVAGGIAVQVYLAGLAVFGAASGWAAHGMFGGFLAFPVIGLATYGWFDSRGAVYRTRASLLVLLYFAQIVLVVFGQKVDAAWIAALHPANALAMLVVALGIAHRTTAPRR